jgi:hypothetical protein
MPGRPHGVDSVEKVLAAVGTKFCDAFNAVRHGGPHRLEQKLSATFFFARRTHPQKKSAAGKLLREFCLGSIFDFFNRIDPSRHIAPPRDLGRFRGRADLVGRVGSARATRGARRDIGPLRFPLGFYPRTSTAPTPRPSWSRTAPMPR